jgi:hypothetical protein
MGRREESHLDNWEVTGPTTGTVSHIVGAELGRRSWTSRGRRRRLADSAAYAASIDGLELCFGRGVPVPRAGPRGRLARFHGGLAGCLVISGKKMRPFFSFSPM